MSAWIKPTKVPGAYWALDVVDGQRAAIVSCPCGNAPAVPERNAIRSCDCHRSFFFDGVEVWAFGVEERRVIA